jgi:hypothetical protein
MTTRTKTERDAEVEAMAAQMKVRIFNVVVDFLDANGVKIAADERAKLLEKFQTVTPYFLAQGTKRPKS